MSGLFLNFYQISISASTEISYVHSLSYNDYSSREAFNKLKSDFPNLSFYRDNDKILIWKNNSEAEYPKGTYLVDINFVEKPKVLSKILERRIISFIEAKGYKLFKNKHSNSWEIISPKDVLNGEFEGLIVNRIVHFSPCFFYKEDVLLLGFSLSTSLKNSFSWSRIEFEKQGVDIKGLKGDEERIFANKQSLKRFLETKGLSGKYDKIILIENKNTKVFSVIDTFYNWLDKNKQEITMPFNLSINTISKKYLPLENDLIKSEMISKPQRYFYSNRKNTLNLRSYDQMVKAYQPYSLELYQNKNIKIGVICPAEYQGETEVFIKKIEAKLKEVFHFNSLSFCFRIVDNTDLQSYKDVLYDSLLLGCDLIYVIVNQMQEKLNPSDSPYYVCKAKFIGNGIPTQDIQIETIRQNLNEFTLTNISLNSYAKLGGTAWTIEKEDKVKDELVVGIGSTLSENGEFVLGIAQVFHNDGRYMTGDCSPLSSFSNYAENLENHLFKMLKPLVEEMNKSGTFRLIFHLFKSASEEYEIKAINGLKERLANYNFEFALVHLAYGHNFRLYSNDGKNDLIQGTYIQLSKYSALLHFVSKSDLPLKIELDKRSTYTSLFYIAKQVYWFSHLSHRSYMPSKRTVTIMYPSLMAKMTEELKKVDGWDYERLRAVSEKLWFI
ncbi:Piwi domain-containing protein [Flavobacterium sp. SH_e]|uniref:Piwi domain-containing protein n=1 Tax=Flavobacterium sp. SH_e TaxID=2983767 RepID=UPI0021E3C485|nr:Piwi domain-containing protein [Flavobacterium sp. SH_e]MCV2486509.1 Piwi domain-containing protein [Flavobacterium sp. SH_e]